MAIDIERMLKRVVAEIFGESFRPTYSSDPGSAHDSRVKLQAPNGEARSAGLRATQEWFEITILDLGVGAALFDYDDDEGQKESVLRELALVARAYLGGEGQIEHKRGLFRTHPVVTINVNGHEWKLGRRSSVVHYP